MPAQPLSADQKEDAARLKAIYNLKKSALGLTQDSLAEACGWESQGTVSQYLNGRIPLNLRAALKFSEHLKCSVFEFSPRLGELLLASSNSTDHPRDFNKKVAMVVDAVQNLLDLAGVPKHALGDSEALLSAINAALLHSGEVNQVTAPAEPKEEDKSRQTGPRVPPLGDPRQKKSPDGKTGEV